MDYREDDCSIDECGSGKQSYKSKVVKFFTNLRKHAKLGNVLLIIVLTLVVTNFVLKVYNTNAEFALKNMFNMLKSVTNILSCKAEEKNNYIKCLYHELNKTEIVK